MSKPLACGLRVSFPTSLYACFQPLSTMDSHRLEPGIMPSLETSLHCFVLAHRRTHIGISFLHYRRSGGVLSHIVGKGVRRLVVSPLLPVDFILGNDLLPLLPSLYAQPCVSWKIESPPPYNRGNSDHILGSKDSGLSTKCFRGYVELRPARARDSNPGAMSSLDYNNPPSLALGCSDNFVIVALAPDTR